MSNTKIPKISLQKLKTKSDLKDNFTNTIYKRPFVLEKIVKDLHCENLIRKDPLMDKKKELKKIKIPKILKILQKQKEESKSNGQKPFFHFIPTLNQFKFHKNQRKSNIFNKKMTLYRQRSDFDLPMINKHKKNFSQINEKNNFSLEKNKNNTHNDDEKSIEKLMTSEIMEPKDLFKNMSRNICICSFMNKMPGDKSLHENYKAINDINKINEKYNLNLNLNLNKNDSNSEIFKGKRYTITGKLTQLFQYY